jgi:hypothetical protein
MIAVDEARGAHGGTPLQSCFDLSADGARTVTEDRFVIYFRGSLLGTRLCNRPPSPTRYVTHA